MNHDYEHCIDFNDGCPESCFRAQLVRDLEQNYPPSMEVSWMNFGDFPDCQRNRLANSSPKLENENGDIIYRNAAIDALEEGFKDATEGVDKLSPTYGLIKAVTGIYKCLIGKLPSAQPEKPTEKRTETHACDSISRQATIEKILGQPPEPHYPSWYAEQIKELPPATTEQDWIPVNEEMPPLRHDVWLTVFFHEKWNVTEGYRQDGEFMFWNHGRLESALDEENMVTAWKPKSKPYQPDAK